MKKNDRQTIIALAKTVNYLFIAFVFAFFWIGYYNQNTDIQLFFRLGAVFSVIYLLCYHFLICTYDGFYVGTSKISELVYSHLLSIFLLDCGVFVIFWLMQGSMPALVPVVLFLLVKGVFAFGWAWLFDRLYFMNYTQRKAIVVYYDARDYERIRNLDSVSRKFKIERILHISNEIDAQILDQFNDMDAVFVRGLPANQRNDILKYCLQNGIEVFFWPKIGDVLISGAQKTHMFHVPVMHLQRYAPKYSYLFLKRALDILVSLVGIVLLSPLMLITMYAIRFYDGGPVLYKQIRLTKDAREFKILKFRSMRTDAEKDGVARLSTGSKDTRITPVGKVIRAIRFDELPQLFNILKGDMSLVGPRPERPEIASEYAKEMPEFQLRLQAKAGLTGYAQVYGKYNSLPYDKLQMDLLYLTNPSFLNDIRIMLATVKILFMKESTEGVSEGQVTA